MLFGVECRVTKNHEEAEVHVTETHILGRMCGVIRNTLGAT